MSPETKLGLLESINSTWLNKTRIILYNQKELDGTIENIQENELKLFLALNSNVNLIFCNLTKYNTDSESFQSLNNAVTSDYALFDDQLVLIKEEKRKAGALIFSATSEYIMLFKQAKNDLLFRPTSCAFAKIESVEDLKSHISPGKEFLSNTTLLTEDRLAILENSRWKKYLENEGGN